MRRVKRLLLIYSAIFIIGPLAIGAYYWITVKNPSFDKHAATFHEAVMRISDPEHLKRVVFTVTAEANAFALSAKRMADVAMQWLVIWLLMAGGAFLHVYFAARKHLIDADGKSNDAL